MQSPFIVDIFSWVLDLLAMNHLLLSQLLILVLINGIMLKIVACYKGCLLFGMGQKQF
jgi:hypothetical protein